MNEKMIIMNDGLINYNIPISNYNIHCEYNTELKNNYKPYPLEEGSKKSPSTKSRLWLRTDDFLWTVGTSGFEN